MTHEIHNQRKEVYKDFDFNFGRNPLTNDISVKTDFNAINQSLGALLRTNYYERPFQPKVGSNLKRLLFEPLDNITAQAIRSEIETLIKNYEPRVVIDRSKGGVAVKATPDRNELHVTVYYYVIANRQRAAFTTVLERLR